MNSGKGLVGRGAVLDVWECRKIRNAALFAFIASTYQSYSALEARGSPILNSSPASLAVAWMAFLVIAQSVLLSLSTCGK